MADKEKNEIEQPREESGENAAQDDSKIADRYTLVGGFVNVETGEFVDVDGEPIDREKLAGLLKKNRRKAPLTPDTGAPALCYAIDAPKIPTWNGDTEDKSVLCYAIDTSEIPSYDGYDPDCYYVVFDEDDF